MNDSSITQTIKHKVGLNVKNKIKKKPTPISLINCTQSIFIKNKPGDITTSYLDGSQAIQNAEKAKRLLMNNHITQPKIAHLKNKTNIIKTIQTSILSNHRNYNPKTSHSIVNSFTSNQVSHNKSKPVLDNQCTQEQHIKGNHSINLCEKKFHLQKQKPNITFRIAKEYKNLKSNEIMKAFVRNDKGKILKNKLNIEKGKGKPTQSIINSKQKLNNHTRIETVAVLFKDDKCIVQNKVNYLNSCVQNTVRNITNSQCLNKQNLDSISILKENNVNNKIKHNIKRSSEDISLILSKKDKLKKTLKQCAKISELKILLAKGKNISINQALNHQNEITITNEKEQKKKEIDCKKKETDENQKQQCLNNDPVNNKQKSKAPKCPMRLNLLSLIQENSIKYKTNKDISSSIFSFEDIDRIIQTDPNQLDSKCNIEFDSLDDINAIIRKINFEVINKNAINIFSEDNPVYQKYQENFTERFNKNKLRYYNSEQRTNVSGSTCENSSKKTFIPLSKRDYQMIKPQELIVNN